MSNQETGDVLAAPTSRLVFDQNIDEDAVPQFLKKSYQSKPEGTAAIQEPASPVAIVEPEPVEDTQEEVITTMETAPNSGEDPGPVNLDEMSVEELRQQQEEIDRKIREKQEAEKQAVIDQIVNVVNMYRIPLDELVEALGGLKVKRKGVKAQQKYQDPITGATWSGRGKEPTWIKGKDRKAFLIQD